MKIDFILLLLFGKLASSLLGELPVPNLADFDRPGRLPLVWKSIESLGRLDVIAWFLDDSVFNGSQKAANGWKEKLIVEDIDRVLRIVEETRPGVLYGS